MLDEFIEIYIDINENPSFELGFAFDFNDESGAYVANMSDGSYYTISDGSLTITTTDSAGINELNVDLGNSTLNDCFAALVAYGHALARGVEPI